MSTFLTMTPDRLKPGERVLDHDGDIFVIEEVRRLGDEVALVDDAGDVLWLQRYEPLFLDDVLPRVWRFEEVASLDILPRRIFVEVVRPGDLVELEDGQCIDVSGLALVPGAVTLYEHDEAVRTLDTGTIVTVHP